MDRSRPGRADRCSGPSPSQPKFPAPCSSRNAPRKARSRTERCRESGPATFTFELPASASSSAIDLAGGDDWLGPFTVERVDRPSLAETKLRVKEPGATYTGFRDRRRPAPALAFSARHRNRAHPGRQPSRSRRARSRSRPASAAAFAQDDRTFTTTWKLTEATTLEILLTSARTALASKPTFLSIGLLKDRAPRVTLAGPGHRRPRDADRDDSACRSARPTISGWRRFGSQIDRTTSTDEKSAPVTKRASQALPLPLEKDRAAPGPPGPPRSRAAGRPAQDRHDHPVRGRGRRSLRARRADRPLECASGAGRFAGRAVLRDLDPPAGRAGQVPGGARSRSRNRRRCWPVSPSRKTS